MNPRRSQESLPDLIIFLIISSLPFKEAMKMSLVSKRWGSLCHKMTNIAFKESEFVKFSDDEQTKSVARASFVRYMLKWVVYFTGEEIKSFKLYLSKPVEFATEVMSLIDFTVSNHVKNLDLDFSYPSWITKTEAETRVFQLPESFYNQTNLESLKLFACGFDPSRLAKTCSLKTLSFGWIQLRDIMSLILKCPLLESQNCWDVGLEKITENNNRLRELVFKNCDFGVDYTTLDSTFRSSSTQVGFITFNS
ncbi:unnamed protein product [Arabis nemorensis]|uniref:F-box domain-containing protein n=1 Tax=Arabis nemorensis TaxID=586526 RepID=A0A565CDH1_9BRAS|nr:unnamed protein product [Arabis nemorensis]